MGFEWHSLIYLALALILPVSALMGHRLNWKKGVVMALVWAAIFAATALFIDAVM